MFTYKNIIEEVKNIPVYRLKEAYELIQALNQDKKPINKGRARKKILSFAGAFADMSRADYREFLELIADSRQGLFDRTVSL